MNFSFLANMHWLSQGIAVGLVLLVVVFVSIFCLRAWGLRSVLKQVRQLWSGTDEADPDALGRALEADAPLAHIWQEYRKTLYPRILHQADGGVRQQWVATAPAEVVWNVDLVVEQRLRADFFKHLPGLLTGLGIIGTFNGLIHGLNGFVPTSDPDQTGQQLKPLLDAVGEAFVVSACAIGLAMLVTLLEKWILSALAARVEGIASDLDQRFHPTMAEELLQATVDHTEEAATQLKHLKGELLQDLRPLLQEISDQHRQTLIQMAGLMQQRLEQSTR
ncbi:MAG: hypothetical protein RIQ53_2946, partial [Pseudomonadota bacterium]